MCKLQPSVVSTIQGLRIPLPYDPNQFSELKSTFCLYGICLQLQAQSKGMELKSKCVAILQHTSLLFFLIFTSIAGPCLPSCSTGCLWGGLCAGYGVHGSPEASGRSPFPQGPAGSGKGRGRQVAIGEPLEFHTPPPPPHSFPLGTYSCPLPSQSCEAIDLQFNCSCTNPSLLSPFCNYQSL